MTTSPATTSSTLDHDAHVASATRVIRAPRQVLFDLVADPRRHPDFDGSGTVKAPAGSIPDRLSLGARFGMRMWRVFPYLIQNKVVEFEEGERIAWRHFHGHRWRYEFADTEVDGQPATEVTESFDWSGARSRTYLEVAGYPSRNLGHMEATLERLDHLAAGGDI